MKKHKHRRHEPDPDAPRRRNFRLPDWEDWEDDWDEDLYDDDDDEEDEDWERSLGRIDLWAEHWSDVDSSQAGRWRRASPEGSDRRTA